MRSTLVILIFCAGTVLSRYQDKRRFDRSVNVGEETSNLNDGIGKGQWSFTDTETNFIAHRDRSQNICYLEKLSGVSALKSTKTKILYAPTESLTKLEAWSLAGGRIVDFCRGRTILLLQESRPIPSDATDPFLNELPEDENDIATRRVRDVVLTPLLTRTKRHIILEEREKLNKDVLLHRARRQIPEFRGKFRGQTQSQYLNSGSDDKEGKAEAEATHQSSRAVVSGSRGMGQAQSMSMGGNGCEDCPGFSGYTKPNGTPDRFQIWSGPDAHKYAQMPAGAGTPIGGTDGSRPGGFHPGSGTYPGSVYPNTFSKVGIPEAGRYPDGTVPGRGVTVPGTYTGGADAGPATVGGGTYPGGVILERGTVGGGVYPGGDISGTGTGTYPAGVGPNTRIQEVGTYPGSVSSRPGTTNVGTYPGAIIRETDMAIGDVMHLGTGTGGKTYPGIIPPRTGSVGRVTYPGSVAPGTIIYPELSSKTVALTDSRITRYPGSDRPSSRGGTYLEVTPSGGTTTGGEAIYPGEISYYPGGTRPSYLGSVGGRQTAGLLHGGVQIGGVQPGGVQPGGVQPGGVQPGGVQSGGIQPGGVQPGGVQPGGVQPGGVQPGGVQPGGVQPGGIQPGGVQPGGIQPGGVQPGDLQLGGVQPGDIQRGGIQPGGVHPGGVHPEGVQTGGIQVDGVQSGTLQSGSLQPGTIQPGGLHPGRIYPGGTYPGVVQPGGVHRGSIQPDGAYHGGVQPSGVQPAGIQPGVTYPGRVQPESMQPGGIYHGDVQPGGRYSEHAQSGGIYPGHVQPGSIYPGGVQPGVIYPGGAQPPSGQTIYSGGAMQPGALIGKGTPQVAYPIGTVYPGTGATYSGAEVQPGLQYSPGAYPTQGTKWPSLTGGAQYTGNVAVGQGGTVGTVGVDTGRYSGRYPVETTGTRAPSQYYQQPGGPVQSNIEDDGSDSQASSSVKQLDSGTQASASAQGTHGQGTAQSQVSGTYSGTASFSAQAGTSDGSKGAQAQVSGGKEGAVSNSQGVGGYGKSATQVQLDTDSGATSTGAQSSGWNHGTNSQVQASSKGGMADAQANGEGSTSSQAQIGFQPYMNNNESHERQSRPFRGGGTASAQSGTNRGQSQSQLQGSFQYGITYSGAAQAGSGSGAAASRKPFNFSLTEAELFKPFKPYDRPVITNGETGESEAPHLNTDGEGNQENRQSHNGQALQTSSSSQHAVVASSPRGSAEERINEKDRPAERRRPTDPVYDTNDDYDDEYEDEDYEPSMSGSASPTSRTSQGAETGGTGEQQSQTIQVAGGSRYNVHASQASNAPRDEAAYRSGQSLPGFAVPPGFRGRVTSVAGDDTFARGDGKAQSQTVSLIPAVTNTTRASKSSISNARSLQTSYERFTANHATGARHRERSYGSQKRTVSPGSGAGAFDGASKPHYYTITNSVAGKIDDNKHPARKYEHRYYTKSSTCGYFTFSCNVVYGTNGRTKICKPKMPTYPDGTPMRC